MLIRERNTEDVERHQGPLPLFLVFQRSRSSCHLQELVGPSHLLAANAVKERPLFRPASFLIFLASPENICIPLVYERSVFSCLRRSPAADVQGSTRSRAPISMEGLQLEEYSDHIICLICFGGKVPRLRQFSPPPLSVGTLPTSEGLCYPSCQDGNSIPPYG